MKFTEDTKLGGVGNTSEEEKNNTERPCKTREKFQSTRVIFGNSQLIHLGGRGVFLYIGDS